MSVLVATSCRAENARYIDYYLSRDMMKLPEGSAKELFPGFFPEFNINNAVKRARREGHSHILILDDDVIVAPDFVDKLLAHDVDIVSGNLLNRVPPFHPYFFEFCEPNGRVYPSVLDNKRGLWKVSAVATGCTLIKTSVFDKLEFPWFHVDEDAETYDIYFSNKARQAGFELFIDLNAYGGHIIQAVVWPEFKPTAGWQTTIVVAHQLAIPIPPAEKELSSGKLAMQGVTEQESEAGMFSK